MRTNDIYYYVSLSGDAEDRIQADKVKVTCSGDLVLKQGLSIVACYASGQWRYLEARYLDSDKPVGCLPFDPYEKSETIESPISSGAADISSSQVLPEIIIDDNPTENTRWTLFGRKK